MSIKIREICGSRRCRATLLCIRPSRSMRKSWLVRLRLHPTPKKRDPKSVSGIYIYYIPGASSFVVVSFRNTICELATDNSGAVSLVCTCTHAVEGRVEHTEKPSTLLVYHLKKAPRVWCLFSLSTERHRLRRRSACDMDDGIEKRMFIHVCCLFCCFV